MLSRFATSPYRLLNRVCHFPESSKLVRTYEKQACLKHYKLVIVGGGAGGLAVASKFASKLGTNNVLVIEGCEEHYYQPMFTLVGGGMKKLSDTYKKTTELIPSNCRLIQDPATRIDPEQNLICTSQGCEITYEYLVVAVGLQLEYEKIPGLVEALSIPQSGVCSNYSPCYVERTFEALQEFEEGNLVFTFPNTPVKCAGAPQKICYIADQYLRRTNKRAKARLIYNTSLGVIFGVQKYADALWEICRKRGIEVNLRTNLVAVKPEKKIAVFEDLDAPKAKKMNIEYSVLHVTPPMAAPSLLRSRPKLADKTGFLDVDQFTLRHKHYPNIFGIGDCTNAPTSKTAAAVAAQAGVLARNLDSVMKERELTSFYDGYTSCPLVTGYNKVILAEFDYNLKPKETFPINQGKESRIMFFMKKSVMPFIYWKLMLKGYWNGPEIFRKIFHFDFKSKDPRKSVGK